MSVTAELTLVIAESVFGNPTALARYSPISAESFVNFLRFSSFCLAETSEVAIAPAVTPTKLVTSDPDVTKFDSMPAGFKIEKSSLLACDSLKSDDFFSV